MLGCGECKHCHKRVFDRFEIVTETCMDCWERDATIREDSEAEWQDYLNESDESVRTNQ